jgi:hypothetical protein
MTKPAYTILVNSSDSFEDCWNPFFKLYKKYWNAPNILILLNTEFKTGYQYEDLPITCTAANAKHPERRLTWSECLINALQQVQTDLIIYVQEDYFFERQVDQAIINDFVSMMQDQPALKYIGLTHIGNLPPFGKWPQDPRLCKVLNTPYRISTQAGIWRKDTLLSYLRPEENGWMFEVFGTERAKNIDELFLTLQHSLPPAILYTHTGIIKGKWHPAIPALFAENNIEMDFTQRGFYKEKPYLLRKIETGIKLMKDPVLFYKGTRGK